MAVFTPPRENGEVIPHDEKGLDGSDYVFRRINPTPGSPHLVQDENTGRLRISSGAFAASSKDPYFGMSIDLEPSIIAAGESHGNMLQTGWGSVRLKICAIRDLGLIVGSDPVFQGNSRGDEPNPHHGQVWHVKPRTHRKLHKIVEDWVVPIANVALRG